MIKLVPQDKVAEQLMLQLGVPWLLWPRRLRLAGSVAVGRDIHHNARHAGQQGVRQAAVDVAPFRSAEHGGGKEY